MSDRTEGLAIPVPPPRQLDSQLDGRPVATGRVLNRRQHNYGEPGASTKMVGTEGVGAYHLPDVRLRCELSSAHCCRLFRDRPENFSWHS